ncbi:MAG: 50S ribosomal protein L18 [Gammaproteobacteria bacterium]|jgi:large subunit ribosomal protein L18|eukprot:gnl/TRDRNA2_/TRDRNA2_132568_c3_seq1.p4 gnl/TRDRNA2_/TRDRNA2_132568_c3~~gnl/TRDRNA2_/TRDRNA2_132568_c3_seq1.p4  ORF type:complete len:118 (-),score=6.57 gnl/TRDRNA2_/TRDRNA2_132568_c3_seq1:1581-1934(-)
MSKKTERLRRAKKARARIKQQGANRLTVHKTSRHVYAQIIAPSGSEVLASASSLDKELKSQIKYSGNVEAAAAVGKALAERAKKAGVENVAFDRSGFKYHGRIKALADAAREQGMQF